MTRDHHKLPLAVHAFNGEREAIERIGKFVRLGGFSSTNEGNFWPDLHRNCLRGDR